MHPYFTNEAARAASIRHGVEVEAWSPIAQGKVLDDAVIGEIAAAHGKTPSQVTLRWHLERGDIVFPKSMREERMRENFEIFDFTLTDDQVAAISAPRPGRGRPHRPEPGHLRLDPQLDRTRGGRSCGRHGGLLSPTLRMHSRPTAARRPGMSGGIEEHMASARAQILRSPPHTPNP